MEHLVWLDESKLQSQVLSQHNSIKYSHTHSDVATLTWILLRGVEVRVVAVDAGLVVLAPDPCLSGVENVTCPFSKARSPCAGPDSGPVPGERTCGDPEGDVFILSLR